ncbi:unnamed protein product [Ilex paraguariensis]|uniref:MABP1/WDR62 second WD40 domain-containing protein n=1 Tax=Ilex paraguariensis TaxID=185542 RepID=A0ABC8SHB1_9AQUA
MKPNRKLKKPNKSPKLILEEIIGLTTKNANGLASSISNSNVVYIAGCVVVVYNVDSGTHSYLMVSNRTPKPLSCVAVSQDGNFIAAGESGPQPAVLVWDFATAAIVSELRGHQYGVACMAFSPDGKHLASVGFAHDGYLCLWHWQSGMLVTKLKACSSCSSIASVSFSSDAEFILTAGRKHLKFWAVGSSTKSHANMRACSLVMHGKPVKLAHHKGCSFIAVTSPHWSEGGLIDCHRAGGFLPIYALTDAGLSIRNSVDLKFIESNFQVEKGYALSASKKLVACACNDGVVKLFTVDFLKYAGSLKYTEAKRCNKANDIDWPDEVRDNEFQPLPSLPDAIACQFSTSEKLVVVYGDHSLYIWDLRDVYKAIRCCVLVSHSACIWDIKNLPCENMHDASLVCVARGCSGGVSFATCSADGTIRSWDLTLQTVLPEESSAPALDNNLESTEQVGTTCLVSAGLFKWDSVVSGSSTQGFRAMAVSSDGKHLAAGDCRGNLHIYNLATYDYMCIQDAHDAEILSLSYSMPRERDILSNKASESFYFLASGGRDRMIHLYDIERNYDLIGSVDDHSAAVTSVKLTCNGSKILSCSADRSLVFRDVVVAENNYKISRCHHQMVSHGTVYDMATDPMVEVAATVGQDKKINTFNVATGKLIRSFKHDTDFGDLLKVTMDPSCSYLGCSYSNRSVCIYDFVTGGMVAQAAGHGEVITGVIFLPDCKHLVSVDGDGCIFVWKVPSLLSSRMLLRVEEKYSPSSPKVMTQAVAFSQTKFHGKDDHQRKINQKGEAVAENTNQFSQRWLCEGGEPQETSAFKFSISRLPKWAQAKVTPLDSIPTDPESTSSQQVGQEVFSPSVDNGGGNAAACHVLQTPFEYDVDGSKQIRGSMFINSSDTMSPISPETCSSFSLDRRWLTIHTVCLDLLNSPEVWDMNDIKGCFHTAQAPAVENTNNIEHVELSSRDPSVNNSSVESTFLFSNHVDGQGSTLYEHTKSNNSGSLCNSTDKLRSSNSSTSHKQFVHHVSAQLQSDTTECGLQAARGVNVTFNIRSQKNEFSNMKVGNLSAKSKMEGRTSSAGRCYSGRFSVRQDLFRGQNKLFDTPIRDFGDETMNRGSETDPNVTMKDLSMQVSEESKRADHCKQDLKISTKNLISPSASVSQLDLDKLMNMEVTKIRDQEESDFGAVENNVTIVACKEALLNLDAAAENALQLFSKLGSLTNGDEISRQPEAQLCAEATQMLPSIAKKVHAVATLVQSTTNNSCGGTGLDAPSFENMLGTFAESLSQRVVEILKKNYSSL